MRFLPIAVYTTCIAGKAYATTSKQPNVEVVVKPSSDGIKINILVELAILQSDLNSTAGVVQDSAGMVSLLNSTALVTTLTHAVCASDGHATTHGTPTPSSTATAKGFFLNSTSSPAATGHFQSPSLIDLAAFSGGASTRGQPIFLGVVVVATVAMSLV